MVGNGELYVKLQQHINNKKLYDCVFLQKEMTTTQLFEKMKVSDIFLFTSDYQEGWGAILNEAMNAGCACVCSHAPGSVPFIINDNENGLIYHCGNVKDLYEKVLNLTENKDKIVSLGQNAYWTILNEWNYKVAAQKLLNLGEQYKEFGTISCYDNGILSKADILKNHWYEG